MDKPLLLLYFGPLSAVREIGNNFAQYIIGVDLRNVRSNVYTYIGCLDVGKNIHSYIQEFVCIACSLPRNDKYRTLKGRD